MQDSLRASQGVRPLQEHGLCLGGKERTAEEDLQEPAGLLRRKGSERDRRRIALPSAPARLPLEELGTCGARPEG